MRFFLHTISLSSMPERDREKLPNTFSPQPVENNAFQIKKEVPSTYEHSSVSPTPEIPETQKIIEKKEIKTTEEKTQNIESAIDALKRKLKGGKKKKTIIPAVKDELTRRVEQVMEEGLADAYRELTPVQQQEFKIKGEETAWKIRELFKKTHLKVKEVFRLLVEWLRLLPGINKFFIEQEAKIKADKILSLKKYQSRE